MQRRQGDSPAVPTQGDSFRPQTDSTRKIAVCDLQSYLQDWFTDARIGKFFWFLNFKGFTEVGTPELKEFFLYLQTAHKTPQGRWCNPNLKTPMQQISVCNYHRIVKAFFRFLLEEDLIDFDPMRRVKVAREKTEIKPPLSKEDFKRLLNAAKKVKNPHRELAILWTLWDSGVRASELCNLKREDFDEANLLMRESASLSIAS